MAQEIPRIPVKKQISNPNEIESISETNVLEEQKNTITQEEIHKILFNREIGWKEIIYDLINTEQLDPWNINITFLSHKYLEKIKELEEADFFISSKVLFAASLLLRIKSEMLLSKYIKSIDEILFGRKEEKKRYKMEKIELNEEIPELVPKTPMPRVKKVTLNELIDSLNKAINTENRRIKKAVLNKNALRETGISLPKKKYSIKDRIKDIYNKLINIFKYKEENKKISYTEFIGENSKNKRLEHFFPLLHLENQQEIWLDQEAHFEEIHIWEKQNYLKQKGDPFGDIKIEHENLEKEEELKKEKKQEREKMKQEKIKKKDNESQKNTKENEKMKKIENNKK